jgi:hypothetical protein
LTSQGCSRAHLSCEGNSTDPCTRCVRMNVSCRYRSQTSSRSASPSSSKVGQSAQPRGLPSIQAAPQTTSTPGLTGSEWVQLSNQPPHTVNVGAFSSAELGNITRSDLPSTVQQVPTSDPIPFLNTLSNTDDLLGYFLSIANDNPLGDHMFHDGVTETTIPTASSSLDWIFSSPSYGQPSANQAPVPAITSQTAFPWQGVEAPRTISHPSPRQTTDLVNAISPSNGEQGPTELPDGQPKGTTWVSRVLIKRIIDDRAAECLCSRSLKPSG